MGVSEWDTQVLEPALCTRPGHPSAAGYPQPSQSPKCRTLWRNKNNGPSLLGIPLAGPLEDHSRLCQVLYKLCSSQSPLPQAIWETKATPNPSPPMVLNIYGFHQAAIQVQCILSHLGYHEQANKPNHIHPHI